ncbi:aldehyde dehydrogenase family protein [[Empedobacter] haloabium]|uniref:Aldehyde dehydrogenase family protein n=1 Tax=[Empedobacter] haloabium TaxID=592317 RepID=A0ABZ1UFH9_9BURK
MNTRTLDRRRSGAAASAAAASAALLFAQASHGRRAGLMDAIGAALDDARAHLPGLAAADAGITADAALRQHDALRGWLHALSAALRRAELAALAPAPEAVRTVPLGPVAAIGPHATAYGLVGVHALAALAAGCPVLATGSAAQPGAAVLADLIGAAVAACGLPAAAFTLLPADAAGVAALLDHHALRAAISRVGAAPLPHGASLVLLAEADGCEAAFILPGALNGRAEHLGQLLLAHGGPGVLAAAVDGPGYVDLRETIVDAATDHSFAEIACAKVLAQPARAARGGRLLVRCADPAELLALAAALAPQHCASLHLGPADAALATNLLPALELTARHIHINRIGGALLPSPAGAVDAIGRFRRPVFHHPA